MLADELDYVVGVDTHRDEHVIAVVTVPAGAVIAGAAAAACGCGYRKLVAVVDQHAVGRRLWAIEGSGSYGAGLARFLIERGEVVLEVSRAPRAQRRLHGTQPRRRPPAQRALHTIVLHRRQHDPQTKNYIDKRIAEGKSRRDATRLLKRYLARHLYRLLQQTAPAMT